MLDDARAILRGAILTEPVFALNFVNDEFYTDDRFTHCDRVSGLPGGFESGIVRASYVHDKRGEFRSIIEHRAMAVAMQRLIGWF